MISEAMLERMLQRHDALAAAMADPSRGGGENFARLSKEYAELEPVVDGIRLYRKLAKEAADLEEMRQSGDAEMRALAEEELLSLKTRLPEAERKVQLLLLPKD